MAFARKCDRCGKYYDDNTERTSCGTMARRVGLTNGYDRVAYDEQDLCDDCIAKFKRFMAGCELKED